MRKIRKMTSYELHICLFDILSEIDRILKKNEVNYYLAFGTLLGCIREGGPIKWDDDLDIWVKEEYWETMNEVLYRDLDRDKFFLINKKTSMNSPSWTYMTRVGMNGTYRRMDYYKDKKFENGIFVEIQELVGIPESKLDRKIWNTKLGIIDGVINNIAYNKGFYSRPYLVSDIMRIFNNNKTVYDWNCDRYRVQTKYPQKNCNMVSVPFGPFGVYGLDKSSFKNDWFKRTMNREFAVRDKNGKVIRRGMFPIPEGFNEILSTTYGNWYAKPRGRRSKDVSYWIDN